MKKRNWLFRFSLCLFLILAMVSGQAKIAMAEDTEDTTGGSTGTPIVSETGDTPIVKATGDAPMGSTTGDTPSHTLGDLQIIQAATCVASGSAIRVCTTCEAEVAEDIPIDPNTHRLGDWEVSEDKPDYVVRECLNGCGYREERSLQSFDATAYFYVLKKDLPRPPEGTGGDTVTDFPESDYYKKIGTARINTILVINNVITFLNKGIFAGATGAVDEAWFDSVGSLPSINKLAQVENNEEFANIADFYDVEWYVIKFTDNKWHVDGQLIQKEFCIVSFIDEAGTPVNTVKVEKGSSVAELAIPSKDGLIGSWEVKIANEGSSLANVTSDMTLQLVYSPITYIVTFINEHGAVVDTITVNHGGSVTLIDVPKEKGKVGAWKLISGSDSTLDRIICDMTYQAEYESIPCTVRFLNSIEETVATFTVNYGDTVDEIEVPEVEGYTGAWKLIEGSESSLERVTSDMTFMADYVAIPCTVTFISDTEEVVQSITVNYGESVAELSVPVKSGYTGEWRVTVAGEGSTLDRVISDMTVRLFYTQNETTPIPNDPSPTPSDPSPTPSDPSPTPSDPSPTPSDPTPTPSDIIPTPIEPTPDPEEEIDIIDDEVPEGTPEDDFSGAISDTSDEALEDIVEEDIPEGEAVLPQTGTANENVIYLLGIAVILSGLTMLLTKKKEVKSNI